MLPLLDVFMVVLFVFATISEQRLDDSSRERQRLRAQVEQMSQARHEAEAGGQRRDDRREREHDDAIEQRATALAEVKHEAEHLRAELRQARTSFAAEREKIAAELRRAGAPAEALEKIEVLSRVLDKYSVFEIELIGGVDADGGVTNHCCYRVDPLDDRWQACGLVPAEPAARVRWLEEGASGLGQALRRTKGGNAMTLVRQDHAAGHRIASRVVDDLRQRFSDQHFYAEEEPTLADHCGHRPPAAP